MEHLYNSNCFILRKTQLLVIDPIDKDRVTFYVARHTGALRLGKMDGPDAFTLYIVALGGSNPRAGFAEFTRVK